jgi:hypothetical protein
LGQRIRHRPFFFGRHRDGVSRFVPSDTLHGRKAPFGIELFGTEQFLLSFCGGEGGGSFRFLPTEARVVEEGFDPGERLEDIALALGIGVPFNLEDFIQVPWPFFHDFHLPFRPQGRKNSLKVGTFLFRKAGFLEIERELEI